MLKTKRITAIFCAVAFASSAAAQNDLPGETIDLPSVSEYSLPPAEQQPQTPAAEGPSDSPITQPQPVAPRTAPAATPNSRPAARQPDSATPRPAPPATRQQPRRAPTPAPTPSPSRPLAPEPESSAPGGAAETTLPETPDEPIIQDIEAVPEAAETAPETETSDTGPAATNNNDSNTVLYGGVAALAVLLAGFGFFLWRRNTKVAPPEEEAWEAPVAVAETPQASTPRKPAPKIYSPPNPAARPAVEPEPAVDNGGFVTSKIRRDTPAAPATPVTPANPPVQTAPPKPATTTLNKGDLELTMTATGASSTLLNAVLNYEITIINKSAKKVQNVTLSGTMMQADNEAVQNGASQASGPVHDIAELAAGKSVTLKGDIRLPLSAIQPISFKSQALFVPLARFIAQYRDETGTTQTETASFLIGQEHEPPRPKMAPFRLDLGPRNFKPVGQRALNV